MSRAAPLPEYSGDALLLGFSVALISIGLIAIASASIEYSDFHFGNPWHHAERHTLYLVVALSAAAVSYMIPTETFQPPFSVVTVCCFCTAHLGAHARYWSGGERCTAMVAFVGLANGAAIRVR